MTQVVERRKFERFKISLPIRMTLALPSGNSAVLDVYTRNISPVGLSIEVDVEDDPQRVTHFIWADMPVELDIELPQGRSIRGVGRVKWHNFGRAGLSCCFEGGFLLEHMEVEEREAWRAFVENVARVMGEESLER